MVVTLLIFRAAIGLALRVAVHFLKSFKHIEQTASGGTPARKWR
jgi:hypothetical protein